MVASRHENRQNPHRATPYIRRKFPLLPGRQVETTPPASSAATQDPPPFVISIPTMQADIDKFNFLPKGPLNEKQIKETQTLLSHTLYYAVGDIQFLSLLEKGLQHITQDPTGLVLVKKLQPAMSDYFGTQNDMVAFVNGSGVFKTSRPDMVNNHKAVSNLLGNVIENAEDLAKTKYKTSITDKISAVLLGMNVTPIG